MMSTSQPVIPVPPQPLSSVTEKRLWIGNLDLRITEYNLLKMLQQHGAISKLDFIYHRIGPLAGQPRGYAFVTYGHRKSALSALQALDGACLMGRRVAARWASVVATEELERPNKQQFQHIPALAGANQKKSKFTRKTCIRAIEEKLRNMAKDSKPEFQISSVPSHAMEDGPASSQLSVGQMRPNMRGTVHQVRTNSDASGHHPEGRQRNLQYASCHKPQCHR